jgi:hypothetical protein
MEKEERKHGAKCRQADSENEAEQEKESSGSEER